MLSQQGKKSFLALAIEQVVQALINTRLDEALFLADSKELSHLLRSKVRKTKLKSIRPRKLVRYRIISPSQNDLSKIASAFQPPVPQRALLDRVDGNIKHGPCQRLAG